MSQPLAVCCTRQTAGPCSDRTLCYLLSRVLERIGARALVAHVRTFADFLVYEFSTSAGGQQLNKCIEILNDMVWKYNIVTLDRLILCLVRIHVFLALLLS